jgi:hemin uptake protein HemP
MKKQCAAVIVEHGNADDTEYDHYVSLIQSRFSAIQKSTPIFTTDADRDALWKSYISGFKPSQRQHHNCHACRTFIGHFGSLVMIGDGGRTMSVMWDANETPRLYRTSVEAMLRIVSRAKVTGHFLSSHAQLGTRVTGKWHHFAVNQEPGAIYRKAILTAGQAMAEKREDFKNVVTALSEFPLPIVEEALRVLESDTLFRAEKAIGQARWLRDLLVARTTAKGTLRTNIMWRAIAAAPAGFCHPRTSMIGTLLEDLAAGMDFATVSRRWKDKMHPLQYQRPQAAPTAGAIAAAEKIVEQLGAAGSLARRFCRLDEVVSIWRPPVNCAPCAPSVFRHLQPKGAPISAGLALPVVAMAWEKFRRTVLPAAERIEYYAAGVNSYAALVTAVNSDAPPILQWDRDDRRNPVSWYFWNGGSRPEQFCLASGQYHDVDAISLKPSQWNDEDENAHQGASVMFVLHGAKETRQSGNALFPEILRAEFHGIRSVLEAYSRNAKIDGMEEAHAAGVMFAKGQPWDIRLRVTQAGKLAEYRLDRWD